MLTGFLILFPLLAALLLFSMRPKSAKSLALAASLIELAASLVLVFSFDKNSGTQFAFDIPWVNSLGIHFSVGVDGISLLLVLLTTVLVPFIILSSVESRFEKSSTFYGLILMMQMALVGVFTANDGFLFYVFWELALIPIYFICLIWGGENRGAITFKFFVYTLFGSLFMLIGFIYLYNHTNVNGLKSWAIQDLYNAGKS